MEVWLFSCSLALRWLYSGYTVSCGVRDAPKPAPAGAARFPLWTPHGYVGKGNGMNQSIQELPKDHPLLREIAEGRECGWINPDRVPFEEAAESLPLGREGMEDASLRLSRFAPLGMRLFPETKVTGGIIESPSRADSEDAGRTCGKGYFRIWHALSDRGFWYCHCKLRQGKRRNPGGLNAHRRSGT